MTPVESPRSYRRFREQAGPTFYRRQFIVLIWQEALIGCSVSLDQYCPHIGWSWTSEPVTMGSSICSSLNRTKQRGNSESVRLTRANESIERFLNCLEIYIGDPRCWVGTAHSLVTSRPTMLTLSVSVMPGHTSVLAIHVVISGSHIRFLYTFFQISQDRLQPTAMPRDQTPHPARVQVLARVCMQSI